MSGPATVELEREVIRVESQPGPQQAYLESEADIAIIGGAAGGGKTYGLLLECLRAFRNGNAGAVVFRRTYAQIAAEGGLWDDAGELYPLFEAVANESEMSYTFPSGYRVKFSHMQHDKDRLQWKGAQIPVICFDQLEDFCLHPETEVLSAAGWKLITDVEPGERVASLGPNREIIYQPVSRVWRTPCKSGRLINLFKRNGVSFRATVNHRWPIQTQRQDGAWRFKRTSQLKHDRILRCGEWLGGERIGEYKFQQVSGRGLGPNANVVHAVSMDIWLRFLGWWFAEGGTYVQRRGSASTTPQVHLCQTGEHTEEMRDAIAAIGFRFHENTKTGMFTICSRQLYNEVAPLGNTYTKRIPRWIFGLPRSQIEHFWDAFVAGDGSLDAHTGAIQFGLANEGLVDDLQEMAFLLGRVAAKGMATVTTGGKEFQVHRLSISRSERSPWTYVDRGEFIEERYEGDVWCLVVPGTETFLIRHRGRCCWSGNTEAQFWYLLSRSRSARAGFSPYIRATCNPVPESDKIGGWLNKLIAWWIDEEGYAIPERSGVLRWFARHEDVMQWAESSAELVRRFPKALPKSLTFIPAVLEDNPALLKADPAYLANLEALPKVERLRLRKGNWKVKPEAGLVFDRGNFESIPMMPTDVPRWVRYWDKAGTAGGGKYSAGVLLGQRPNGRMVVADCTRGQWSSHARNKIMLQEARADAELGVKITTYVEQEPGSGGKESAEISVQDFVGRDIRIDKVTGSKYDRAQAWSAQVEAGNADLVAGHWNEEFLEEHNNFTGDPSDSYTDQVDAASGACNKLRLDKPRQTGAALW